MHSGIGNRADLQKAGIKPIINLPDVGYNLTDHTIVLNAFIVDSTNTDEPILRNNTILDSDVALWRDHQGPLVADIVEMIGFQRLPANFSLPAPDATPGGNSPHFETLTAVCIHYFVVQYYL